MKRFVLLLVVLCVSAFAGRADELHLKDGTKIEGTIVGYEGNSFRVKTSYGFALVDRASVVSITVADANAKAASAKAVERRAASAPAKKESLAVAAAKLPSAPTPPANASTNADPNAAVTTQNHAQGTTMLAGDSPAAASPQKTQPSPASAAAPAAAPDPTPAPVPVREELQNNLYINDTYGFRLYRPPDWQLIDGARAALPGAIAALGTQDQTTYLLIGLESTNDTFEAHVTTTNDRLGDAFYNFRPSALRQTLIAGLPACEYQFQGMANNQLWSGTVALIRRGENIFTVFGVTVTSSDLVQIQQNIISRAIASLQFTKPQ